MKSFFKAIAAASLFIGFFFSIVADGNKTTGAIFLTSAGVYYGISVILSDLEAIKNKLGTAPEEKKVEEK